MHDRHKGITADENDMKQLQLHTHKVQAKSTCKFGAHDKRLDCLGVDKYSGKKWEKIAERFVRNSSLTEGVVYGQGQNGHFHCVIFFLKMTSTEWAGQNEDVGFGITSFRVTGKKIRTFKTQGLVCKNTSTNRSLVV